MQNVEDLLLITLALCRIGRREDDPPGRKT